MAPTSVTASQNSGGIFGVLRRAFAPNKEEGSGAAASTESTEQPQLGQATSSVAPAASQADSPGAEVTEEAERIAVLSAEALAEAIGAAATGGADASDAAAALRSVFSGWSERQMTAAAGRLLGASPGLAAALASRLCTGDSAATAVAAPTAPEESLSRELRFISSGEVLKARDSLAAKEQQPGGLLGPGGKALMALCDLALDAAPPDAPSAAVAELAPEPAQLGAAAALSIALFADACAAAHSKGSGPSQAALAAQWSAAASSHALLSLAQGGAALSDAAAAASVLRPEDRKEYEALALDALRKHAPAAVAAFRARRSGGGTALALLEEAAAQGPYGGGGADKADPAKAVWERVKRRDGEAAEEVAAIDELLTLIGLDSIKREFISLYERVQIAKQQGRPPSATLNARFEGCERHESLSAVWTPMTTCLPCTVAAIRALARPPWRACTARCSSNWASCQRRLSSSRRAGPSSLRRVRCGLLHARRFSRRRLGGPSCPSQRSGALLAPTSPPHRIATCCFRYSAQEPPSLTPISRLRRKPAGR